MDQILELLGNYAESIVVPDMQEAGGLFEPICNIARLIWPGGGDLILSLAYKVSFRIVRAITQRNPILKNQKPKSKKLPQTTNK